MKRIRLLLPMVCALVHFSTVSAQVPLGWKLVFEDDFDTLSLADWTPQDTSVPTNDSRQDYLPEQVTAADGYLIIKSEKVPSRGLPYRSGQIVSRRAYMYGRFEVRADLPATTGMWPAIWLLPDVKQWPWPSGGEIDIMENRGNQPFLTSSAFHYGVNDGQNYKHSFVLKEQTTHRFGQPVNFHDGFHTYAVEWEGDRMRFYVDDVLYHSVYDDQVGGFLTAGVDPMNIVINTAIGGHFLPNPDESTVWPQEFLVDWVRVYERAMEPAEITARNGSFEENGGSLAGWSVVGAAGDSVAIHDEPVLDGKAALRISGKTADDQNEAGVAQIITVREGDEVKAGVNVCVLSLIGVAAEDNHAVMRIEFYNRPNGKPGSEEMIGSEEVRIADHSTPEDKWLSHSIRAQAPAESTEARIALFLVQPSGQPGAIYVDEVNFGRYDAPK